MSDRLDFDELTPAGDDRKDVAAGERLRTAVDRAGGVAIVARRAGISAQSIYRFIKGREMRRSSLEQLADACEIRVEWLATGRGSMEVNPTIAQLTLTPAGDAVGEPVILKIHNYLPIPKYDIKASAGPGKIVVEEQNNGYFALEEKFLRQTLGRRRQDLVCIEAAGDSMEPTIHDGDLLVIDTTVVDIQSSRVYVLSVNGELLVKRLSLRLDGSVMVRSDNTRYPEELVQPSERTTLRIVGQVVYQAGPVRS